MKRLFLAAAFAFAAFSAQATDFTVRITDAASLAGIAAAQASYCASLPAVVTADKDGKSVSTPAVCDAATPAAYVQKVMADAAASYARQFDTAGAKKAEFLAAVPPDKRAAVQAAVDAVLAK